MRGQIATGRLVVVPDADHVRECPHPASAVRLLGESATACKEGSREPRETAPHSGSASMSAVSVRPSNLGKAGIPLQSLGH